MSEGEHSTSTPPPRPVKMFYKPTKSFILPDGLARLPDLETRIPDANEAESLLRLGRRPEGHHRTPVRAPTG